METYSEAAMQAEVAKLVNENNDDILANRKEELAHWKKAATGQPLDKCRQAVGALLKKIKDGLKADLKTKAEAKAKAEAEAKLKAEAGSSESTIRKRILAKKDEWMRGIATGGMEGLDILPSVANVARITGNEPGLRHLYRLNAMELQIWMSAPPPWKPAGFAPYRITDTDAIELQIYLQEQVNQDISKTAVQDAVDVVAAANSFNPLSDYLAECRAKWDGGKRLDSFAAGYLGGRVRNPDEAEMLRIIGRKFLISAAARALKPGCKVDHLLLLVGKQGLRKSSAIAALCPEAGWFSDSLPGNLGNKDALSHLLGLWLVEIPELDQYKGRPAHMLKAYLSKQADRYRPAFGRREITAARACVFLGSANGDEPLADQTGGRRFWPVVILAVIDVARIEAHRDQLWGEAVAALEAGEEWHIDAAKYAKVAAMLVEEQDAHTSVDPWVAPIAVKLQNASETYIPDVFEFALKIPPADRTLDMSYRISTVLQALGWQKSGARHKIKRDKWVRSEDLDG